MKRFNNLYDNIISLENLELADKKARKGKLQQKGVMIFDKHREDNLKNLHEALKNETFKTSKYTVFKVFEPKEREIYRLPYFPDRIVHHAIMNVLEPIWLKTFTYNTYSCIKDRGISTCAAQVERIIKSFDDRPLYCLKIDIKKYYPSVDNSVLKVLIRKKIKDKRLLNLLDGIIDSEKGLPIGNYLSQYLSNLYLAYFMHYVNEELKIKATEYADDICFFADNKEVLREVLAKIKDYLQNLLNLKLKPNYQIFPIAENRYNKTGRALDYVGFKFFRKQKLIRKSIKQNLCRKLAKLKGKNLAVKELKQQIAPWLGWCKYSNSKHLLKKIMDFKDLVKNGTVKEDDSYFNCDRISIENLVNKRIEVLGAVSDVKTQHGSGRTLVHCKDNEKELKFFTNCKMIKDVLSQLTEKDFPFFTTIATVRDGSHKYYKFT